MPPCRCRFPCRNPGSTRVPSIEITKIRRPFLAIERGIAARTTTVFRPKDRRNRWASTMVVTINIRLDRKLLHSCATSRVNPGIDRMTPFCVTGIPNAENSILAEVADHCCQKATILFKTGAGMGTSQNRKQRGNRNWRAMRAPKHKTKDPIHQITIAAMLTESWISLCALIIRREYTPIRIAITNRAEPSPMAGLNAGFNGTHSVKIKAAIIGTIKSRWVYSSARSASSKVRNNGCQPIKSEIAHRSANGQNGDSLVIAFAATVAPDGFAECARRNDRGSLGLHRT